MNDDATRQQPTPPLAVRPSDLHTDRVELSLSLFHREVSEAIERCARPAIGAISAQHALDPWLTVADGAAHAAVSEDTLRDWMRAGALPHGRAGRVLRVRRSDIDALLLAKSGSEPGRAVSTVSQRTHEIMQSLKGKSHG